MHNHITIDELKPGEKARLFGFAPLMLPHYRNQLLMMGLTPHTPFQFIRTAPLGDPIHIRVRGTELSLRKAEMQHCQLERVSP